MIKQLFFTFVFIWSSIAFTQNADALLWTSASLEGKINKDFNFELNTQFRFDDNMSRLASSLWQMSVDYELGKLFKIAGGYRLSNNLNKVNYGIKHRLYSDIKFDYELFKNFELELRGRFQYDFDRLSEVNDYVIPQKKMLLRFRYGFEYDFNDWKPSVSNEFFYNFDDAALTAYRLNVGLGYKISKRHQIKLEYTFQSPINEILYLEHIYQIGYVYDLKGKLFK